MTRQILGGITSLLKGMKITLSYLVRPGTVVTAQYPENRATLKLSDRVRAQLSLTHDDQGFHKCTSCHICEQACPNASIHVVDRKTSATGKPELDFFIWRLDSCTFCNLCVMVCPFQCLKMSPDFESAVYDQQLLISNLTRYAGPTSTVLMKIADPEERHRMIEARDCFSGPTALAGYYMDGIAGVSK